MCPQCCLVAPLQRLLPLHFHGDAAAAIAPFAVHVVRWREREERESAPGAQLHKTQQATVAEALSCHCVCELERQRHGSVPTVAERSITNKK